MSHDPEATALAYAEELMRSAVAVLERYPADYLPAESEPPLDADDPALGPTVLEVLQRPGVEEWLRALLTGLPGELRGLFLEASGLLGQIAGSGETEDDLLFGPADDLADPQARNLLDLLARLGREEDPVHLEEVVRRELVRRRLARRTPCARTLTTLLGEDALTWLAEDSREDVSKIQLHEFSRTGWPDLLSIEHQLSIERELSASAAEFHYLAKIAVGISWTLAALASFVDPALFLGERLPYLSSVREGNVTFSQGGTRTLLVFEPAAMVSVVRILADGLANPLLRAADLMWMGAGLTRVREVRFGEQATATAPVEERFDLFLSHRGRDSKRALSAAVRALPPEHGVFLDCLTLPHGMVNRNFVFGSMARSSRVLIVQSENFDESEWCRKEAWFAEALEANDLAEVERRGLPDAERQVASVGPETTRRRPDVELDYPIASRVLRDVDYWARAPNLHSLREAGHGVELFTPLRAVLGEEPRSDDPDWVGRLAEAVTRTLGQVVAEAPEAEPFDLWASALQLALAAFGSTSNGRSKVEIRRGVDRMLEVLGGMVRTELHRDAVFGAAPGGYLALLAAATAIDLAGFALDPRMEPALRLAMGEIGSLRDRVLLLDSREPGARRGFHLRLLALLVGSNVGSVGIVQDAADEVHRGHVDGMPLEVLPCVTLYPGMDDPFAPAAGS